jgi:hypothetical protein
MNRKSLLMAVATAALIAGTGSAFAQQEPPRAAPAEKTAPKAPGGEVPHNTAAPTGKSDAAPKGGAMHNGAAETKPTGAGQAQTETTAPTGAPTGKSEAAPKGGAMHNGAAETKPTGAGQAQAEPNRATTGQAAAPGKGNASAAITPEKRTRFHEAFGKERSAPRVDHVDFGVTVGTAIPRSVRVVAVPQEIIEIEPTWRGYEYFMVGDQIVIVDPRSMEIVAVIDA